MAKKLCWLGWLKRLFVSEAKTKEEKKPKRWRWVFGRFKFRQQPAITAPQRTLREATEEQRKHAINVAIATAAAAEAAVAAAQAAAEVVRLAGASKSNHHFNKGDRNLAAIKIQSAFRAYLARKALRALKGLVRLQAIVRGQAVRRQVVSSLKCLPSSAKIQSEVQEKCIPAADRTCSYIDRKHCLKAKEEMKEKETQHEGSSERSWDCSTLSKEDIEAIWLRKQEAVIKRERMLRYSYSHQERKSPHMLLESVYNKESGRRSCRLEQWADTEGYGREGTKTLKTVYSNVATGVHSPAQLKLRKLQKHDSLDVLNSPISLPRRSFCHTENNAAGDDSSILSSQGFPMYMAVTQSAKARSRSVSIPKQRVGFMDPQFENHMLYKDRISFWSSYNGESIITDIKSGNSQRTPI